MWSRFGDELKSHSPGPARSRISDNGSLDNFYLKSIDFDFDDFLLCVCVCDLSV